MEPSSKSRWGQGEAIEQGYANEIIVLGHENRNMCTGSIKESAGSVGGNGSRRQATGKRPVNGMSITPHRLGLWGSVVTGQVHNGSEGGVQVMQPWHNNPWHWNPKTEAHIRN